MIYIITLMINLINSFPDIKMIVHGHIFQTNGTTRHGVPLCGTYVSPQNLLLKCAHRC